MTAAARGVLSGGGGRPDHPSRPHSTASRHAWEPLGEPGLERGAERPSSISTAVPGRSRRGSGVNPMTTVTASAALSYCRQTCSASADDRGPVVSRAGRRSGPAPSSPGLFAVSHATATLQSGPRSDTARPVRAEGHAVSRRSSRAARPAAVCPAATPAPQPVRGSGTAIPAS